MARNADVARVLRDLADAHEVRRDAFRAKAYQRAARAVEAWPEPVEALAAAGRLQDIPGVGAGIAAKVTEFLASGRLAALERLRAELPDGTHALMAVPGVGPRRAIRLGRELGIRSVRDLEVAARSGRLRALRGFGERSERAILDGIRHRAAASRRIPYHRALDLAEPILEALRRVASGPVEAAGSLRRGRDRVGDLDLVAAGTEREAPRIARALLGHSLVAQEVEAGKTLVRARLRGGLGVDLRIVAPESFGAALLYFTGSKEHNVALRARALRRGWSLNEYSLHEKGGKVVASETEADIYGALGLPLIPPELREGPESIEAAQAGRLPRLLERADLKGDLHLHTLASDGRHSLRAMAQAARRRGLEWIGVSDHGEHLRIANGLDEARYRIQRREAEQVEAETGFRILQGGEVDILRDGSLGLAAAARRRLDFMVGSIHSSFRLDPKEQTARLVKAIHGGIDILGHPSGRRSERAGIEADWDAVFDAARDAGVALELDGSPDRLDLPGEQALRAKRRGCRRFAVDSDAHSTTELALVEYGIVQARRGWLEPAQVINCLGAGEVVRHLGHGRA